MIIAQAKRKENIAEYLLYMWQVEDTIRAYHFDIDEIDKNIISRFQVDDETKAKIKDWYENLIKMMELEHVKEKGHLQINKKRAHHSYRPAPSIAQVAQISTICSTVLSNTALHCGIAGKNPRSPTRG